MTKEEILAMAAQTASIAAHRMAAEYVASVERNIGDYSDCEPDAEDFQAWVEGYNFWESAE